MYLSNLLKDIFIFYNNNYEIRCKYYNAIL